MPATEGKGVQFVGINTDDDLAAALRARASGSASPTRASTRRRPAAAGAARDAAAVRRSRRRWCSTATAGWPHASSARSTRARWPVHRRADVPARARRDATLSPAPSRTARCCSRCRWRRWPGWCRSSRRACCRWCPATWRTSPGSRPPRSSTTPATARPAGRRRRAVRRRLHRRLRQRRRAVGGLGAFLLETATAAARARRPDDRARAGVRGLPAVAAARHPHRPGPPSACPGRRCWACSSGSAGRRASARRSPR